MSANIEFCPGKVHVFKQGSGSEGVGFYKLTPTVDVGSEGKVLVMGVPLEFREIVQPVVTLDDRRILYSFGSAWSSGSAMLKILLGESSGSGQALNSVQSWYSSNRLSALKGSIELSIANKAHEVFLIGMSLGAADANYNTQDVTLSFMLSED